MSVVYMILGIYIIGMIINSLIVLTLIFHHKKTHIVTSINESFDFKKTLQFIFLSWYSFNKALEKIWGQI